MSEKSIFKVLSEKNVNEYTEQRDGLTYLTWSKAWAEVVKIYPDATYVIEKFENNLPYVYDENTGYMVFTKVTIGGITHEMWLPVMDGKNKAMLNQPYKYTTKYGEKTVEKATMFDSCFLLVILLSTSTVLIYVSGGALTYISFCILIYVFMFNSF